MFADFDPQEFERSAREFKDWLDVFARAFFESSAVPPALYNGRSVVDDLAQDDEYQRAGEIDGSE